MLGRLFCLFLLLAHSEVALASEDLRSRLFLERSELEIAFVPTKATIPEPALKKAFATIGARKGVSLKIGASERKSYPGLENDALEFTIGGLTRAQRASVSEARNVATVSLRWPRTDASVLRSAYEVIDVLATRHQAIIFDRHAQIAMDAATFRDRRITSGWHEGVPSGPWHFQVHKVPQNNGLMMLDTGGLRRFGIADFEVLDVNRASLPVAESLVNLVAQRLIEGGRLDAKGRLSVRIEDLKNVLLREDELESVHSNAKKHLLVGFKPAEISLGGRKDALELTFPEFDCDDRGECLDAAHKQLFGWKDSVQNINHDERVLSARDKAMTALAQYRALVQKGLPHGETLLVKARFEHDAGNEWMWVDVTSWQGEIIRGRLDNEPQYVTTVKGGATVEVKLQDVLDYMYTFPDGTFLGNEVGKVTRPDLFEDAGEGRLRLKE